MAHTLRPCGERTTARGRLSGLLGAGAVLLAISGCGVQTAADSTPAHREVAASQPPSGHPATAEDVTKQTASLPRTAGRQWFPADRLVAYYGTPGTASLGVLGATGPEQAAARVEQVAKSYQTPGKTVVPTFELIATVADPRPGADGSYCHTVNVSQVWTYLRVAREHHMALILDVQPGRANFLSEVKYWAPLLKQPEVGLALDAEWSMGPGQVPARVIGHTDAAHINAVTDWLSRLVRDNHLPQKILLLHQFKASMIVDPAAITPHPELAMVQHLDGFGTRSDKVAIYKSLERPKQFHMGFKLFYKQDIDMMGPANALAISPTPDYVSYQ